MTDHTADCGHNHDPNPYTDPMRSTAYGHVVRNLFRLSVITCGLDPRLSTMYAACTLVGLADPRDRLPTFRAMLWELGSLVNIMTGGKEPVMETHHCDDMGHDHDPTDDSPEALFGAQAMKAFFAAASIGELESAVKVVDAVRGEAEMQHTDPDAFAAQFFGNVVTSVAFTARANYGDVQLSIFEED